MNPREFKERNYEKPLNPKYENVYSFRVIDEIKAGNTVYVLDRLKALTSRVNSMATVDAIDMIYAEDEERYLFWKITDDEGELAGA